MSFYDKLSANYDEIFPLDEARVSFVTSRVKPGGSILDAGCATGALAVRLSEEGFFVDGFDNERAMIDLASRRPNPAGARFFVGDMERMPEGRRDAVLCLGNTLVHLDRGGLDRFLLSTAALLEDGLLVIQVLNYDRIQREGIRELPLIETKSVRFHRKYRESREGLRFEVRLEEKQSGGVSEGSTLLHPITAPELTDRLAEAGFSNIVLHGDFKGGEFGSQSYHLIAQARR